MRAPTEPEILSIQREQKACVIEIAAAPELYYFRGHFDTLPILPGIVQLHWALRFAKAYLPLGASRLSTLQVKFRRPVRPGDRLALRLTLVELGWRRELDFEYRGETEIVSSGKFALAEP